MLIYNNKKEFIGIDEEDLNKLGFSNLSELMAISADFADMFEKEPGLVHNFNHVSWIDFVECSESIERSRVIINTKSRTFKCYLDVKTAYLADEPSSKAYFINLINLRELTGSEDKNKFDDIVKKPTPIMKTQPIIDIEIPEPEDNNELKTTAVEIPELEIELDTTTVDETEITIDKQIQEEHEESIDLDIPLDLDFDDKLKEIPIQEEKKLEKIISLEVYENGYIYDPQIASSELGLPVDLIEEFIEDFIAQAKEFKDELYQSFNNGEKENVKILSHKLKGVAANLRIEDAFESLTIINTSENNDDIKTNLDILYKIISKLSGEKIEVKKTATVCEDKIQEESSEVNAQETTSDLQIDEVENFEETNQNENNDKYELDIFTKNDEPIKDSEVPEKIDILELSDDNFLNQDEEEMIEIDNTIDIETITNEETLSLENESIEMDDIEPLDGVEIDTNETIDIVDSGSTTYNKRNIAEEIGINYENFLELYEDYTNEAKDISNSISDAIEINNPAIWKNKAAQLKAMCNNMRMDEFIKELEVLIETENAGVAKDASNSLIEAIIKISN